MVEGGEACDDGDDDDDDECTNACALPGCGDGSVQDGEECGLGAFGACPARSALRSMARMALSRCGSTART